MCPQCGRRFARPKQAHSCQVRKIDDHFRGKGPELRNVFDALCTALKRTGPLRVDAVESTINLVSTHHFGGVAVRRHHLRLGFLADRTIRDARIVRAERVGPHRISHHVALRSIDELDAQLLGWLAAAQALQSRSNRPANMRLHPAAAASSPRQVESRQGGRRG
jgi:hypothetical protein